MEPNDLQDSDVFTARYGQISPGCLTADAVLNGHNNGQHPRVHTPLLSYRGHFGTIIVPERVQNPLTFLHPGSFVLFQLDNRELATELQVPEDSELFQRLLEVPTKRYAGLVLGSFGGGSDPDVQPYDVAFMSGSLPPGSGWGTTFSVPIFPMRPGDDSGHTQLRPKPFPWIGCHQYTTLGAQIAPTHTYPSAIEYRLSEEELYTFDLKADSDRDYLALNAHNVSFASEEEEFLFQSMRRAVFPFPLPVKVWQELGVERVCRDPRGFVEEVLHFEELVEELCR